MSRAFRCPSTGLADFCDDESVTCPYCGETHEAYSIGSPRREGRGYMTPASIRPFYSEQHGCRIESISDWKRKNREMHLTDDGPKLDGYAKSRLMSYPGQTRH
jgi:uncharacterized Zn finger protein (UPF0148 family)